MEIIAQIFGFAAIGCSLIIYVQKTKGKLLGFKAVQDSCWCMHYLLLGHLSAMAANLISLSREFVFNKVGKGKQRNSAVILWLPFFLTVYAISAALTWKGIFSILPAVSSSIYTVGFWLKNPRHTKMLATCGSLCTLIYNIMISKSVSVYVGVSLTIISALYSLLSPYFSKKTDTV